jgi:dihydropyrimidinase
MLADGLTRADVVIDGDRIVSIGRHVRREGDRVTDATGQIVLPGAIDVHTHLESPSDGLVTTDDFTSGTIAAAAGGTTSIIDFAIQQPELTLSASLDLWLERLRVHPPIVDVGLHMIVTEIHSAEAERELVELASRGVTSFKIFMAYKGSFMVDDETIFRTARAAAACGAVVMVHAENGDVIDVLTRDAVQRGETAPAWHGKTRPPETEAEAIVHAIGICEMARAPAYIVHVSSRVATEAIARARTAGAHVWGETCPQYLTFTDDVLDGDPRDAVKYVFTPPPRSAADRAYLWDALRAGTLSVVSTDHCPYLLTEKLGHRFDAVPQGAPGIGSRLIVLFDRVLKGELPLDVLVDVCCRNPARLFGMAPDKGAIRIGGHADLVILDPAGETVVSATSAHSRADHSLYEGMRFAGAVRSVFVRGRGVVEDGVVADAPEAGRFIPRGGWQRETDVLV